MVQNSTEKSRGIQSKDGSGPPPRSRTAEHGQHNKPVNQEQREGTAKKFSHNSRDERAENKRPNTDKANEKLASEGKEKSLSNPKDKETRSFNSEPHNNERAREGNQGNDDRQNNRADRNERMDRPVARGQPLRPQASKMIIGNCLNALKCLSRIILLVHPTFDLVIWLCSKL